MTVTNNVQHTRQSGQKAAPATPRPTVASVALAIPPFSYPGVVQVSAVSGAWFPEQALSITGWHYSAVTAGTTTGNTVYLVYVGDAGHNLDGTTETLVLTITTDQLLLETTGTDSFTIGANQYIIIYVDNSVSHENVVIQFFGG